MPRGKVITEPAAAKAKAGASDTPASDVDGNKSASKFKLVEAEAKTAKETEEAGTGSFQERFSEKTEHTPMNFKFTLLLVAVFVAVNIGLIALLDKDRPEDATPVATTVKHEAPVVKNENKNVKENVSVKENAPASVVKTAETKPASAAKPQLQSSEPAKPVLAAPAAEAPVVERPVVVEKPVAAKPIAANPAPAKPQPVHPAATQDLLSIISKD